MQYHDNQNTPEDGLLYETTKWAYPKDFHFYTHLNSRLPLKYHRQLLYKIWEVLGIPINPPSYTDKQKYELKRASNTFRYIRNTYEIREFLHRKNIKDCIQLITYTGTNITDELQPYLVKL
jgi:hypothetical protein